MSRFISHSDMSAEQLLECSYQIAAIIRLCEAAAWGIQNGRNPVDLADAIGAGLRLAYDLSEPVHDALASHKGVTGK